MTVATVQAPRRLSEAERDALLERVQAGESYGSIAADFGVSRARVGQIVIADRKARKRETDEEVASDLDTAALRIRYAVGLQLVESVDVDQRWQLFHAILFPAADLLEASRERARASVDDVPARAPCKGCGTDARNYVEGCRTCQDRKDGRAKRARQLAARALGDPDVAVPSMHDDQGSD